FPDNYRKDDIAGKDALFKVKINQIKEKQLPELDDEFVKEVSEFETLDEMKIDLREKLLKNAEDQSKTKLEEFLIETVTEASVVEPPKSLVDRQIDRMIGDMESYLRYQGMELEQFLQLSGKSKEEIREERREEAAARAKANLVLDAVAKKEGIIIEDSELDAKIEEIAQSYNDDAERIRGILEKQGRLPVMVEEMRIRKAIDLIVAEANIRLVKKKEKVEKPAKAEKKEPKKKVKADPAKDAATDTEPVKKKAAKKAPAKKPKASPEEAEATKEIKE
ncbi:MAG: hypothetical protein U1E11_10435, partial [Dethiobacteria bacterium]|nr:hypothetical protein [Dethiobacteria bacterium]